MFQLLVDPFFSHWLAFAAGFAVGALLYCVGREERGSRRDGWSPPSWATAASAVGSSPSYARMLRMRDRVGLPQLADPPQRSLDGDLPFALAHYDGVAAAQGTTEALPVLGLDEDGARPRRVSWRGEVGAELEVVREHDYQASSWPQSISSPSLHARVDEAQQARPATNLRRRRVRAQ
jgi:hypothetical protein